MSQLSYSLDKTHYDGDNGSPHGRFAVIKDEKGEVTPTGILESRGLNMVEEESSLFDMFGAIGIGTALRSVAASPTWSLKRRSFHHMFTVPDKSSDESRPDAEDKEESCDFMKEQMDQTVDGYFESKYFHDVPLYQDYLVTSMKADLQRVHQTGLADLVVSQCLPGLQCKPRSPRHAVTSPSPPRVLQDKATSSLWQELPEVQERGLLQGLTARQIRQQETMFELLTSETSYLKSLKVAVQHFQCSKELRDTMSSVDHHTLFSNLRSVFGVAERFLADLEGHFLENVVMSLFGDIVLRHRVKLRHVYVPYVTNMMYQEALISKLQENHRFVFVLHKLEKHPQCQRQTLKSFLVLPFQRITRLKLLLETILKLADPDDAESLTEAISALHEIVSECNRNVLLMKQTEELVHLEKLVDFGQIKAIPLITHGRFLIKEGPLRQTNVKCCPTWGAVLSSSDVYLHLFSDLLLISTQKDGRFSVQDYAVFPYNVHPEDIKADVQGLPPESFMLHLRPCHTGVATSLILVACTR